MVDETPKTNPIEYIRPRGHYTLRTVAICSVILVLGVVIGSSGMYKYLDSQGRLRSVLSYPPDVGSEKFITEVIMPRMIKEYELTEDQIPKVKDIFLTHFEKLGKVRKKTEEDSRKIREDMIAVMKKVLTKEQFDNWQEDLKKMEEWRKRHGRGGPDGRGDRRRDNGGPGPDGPRGPGDGQRPPRRPGMEGEIPPDMDGRQPPPDGMRPQPDIKPVPAETQDPNR